MSKALLIDDMGDPELTPSLMTYQNVEKRSKYESKEFMTDGELFSLEDGRRILPECLDFDYEKYEKLENQLKELEEHALEIKIAMDYIKHEIILEVLKSRALNRGINTNEVVLKLLKGKK